LEATATSEIQSFRTPLKPLTVCGRANAADIEIGVKESPNSTLKALKIHRVDASVQVVRTFETINARLDLLRFAKHSSPQLKFLTPSHLIIFLTDGISKGCEWSDRHQTRMLTACGAKYSYVQPGPALSSDSSQRIKESLPHAAVDHPAECHELAQRS
jgi:hypothetical protein